MCYTTVLEIPGLPALPFPLNNSLLVPNDADFTENRHMNYLFIAFWALHFMRRTLEVLIVHQYKRRMPIVESIGAPVYY